MKTYIKPKTEVVRFEANSSALLAASGERNVSEESLTESNISLFLFEGKENNDDDWDEE